MFASALLAGFLLLTTTRGTLLPETRLEFKVSVTHKAFYDTSRSDPSDGDSSPRPMMASLYFPVHNNFCVKSCDSQYMPYETSRAMDAMFFGNEEAKVFHNFQTKVCCGSRKALHPNNHTIVVLEPGVGTTRYLYGAMAQEIASQGHVVVILDHPYDSNIIEMSAGDGNATNHSVLRPQASPISPFHPTTAWNKTVEDLVQSRVRDINFVLGQLTSLTVVKEMLAEFEVANAFDTEEVAIVGHGLGGMVATHMVTSNDTRFHVSINMGGSPPELTKDTTSTILFFGRSSYRREDDPLWNATWKYLKGRSTEYDMDNAGYMQYSDLPLIAELGGKAEESGAVKGLGPIYGIRSWESATYLARVYLTMYLRNEFISPNEISRELANIVQFYTEMRPWQPRKSS